MEYEFKQILRDFLKESNISQVKFAAMIGVKQSQVSEWLSGKAKPGYDNLRAMALGLGVSADFLLGLRNDYW